MSIAPVGVALNPPLDVLDNGSMPSMSPEAVALLQEAFRSFNEASSKFGDHYAQLERRIQDLNLELETANQRLRQNLLEKERVESYLSTLLESLPIGVIGLDPSSCIHSCNRSALDLLERGGGEIVGRPILEVLEECSSNDEIARGISGVKNDDLDFEMLYQRSNDRRKRVLKLRVQPTNRHDEGSAVRVLLIEDVTEVRRLEQQGHRNSRLAAMGEIAMNVAHEIRNPLGSIELFASMLQRELASDSTNGPLAAHISNGVRCIDHIVSNILQFSRPQHLEYSLLHLNDLLDETLVFAEHALRLKNIRVERHYGQNGCAIWGDSELLKQVFLNLFLNAVQATPDHGMLFLATIPNGRTVEIQVRDTGCGFPKEDLSRVFDPFFTTRRKGTGLGLTIAHNIISAHGGSIEADNHPEGGALLFIVLPKAKPSAIQSLAHCLGEKEITKPDGEADQ